jgi:Xaa-Pro aminopeptidase
MREISLQPFSAQEFKQRHDAIRRRLEERGLEGLVLFAAQRVYYSSGFAHVQTERPVAFVLPLDGEPGMLAPALEAEHLEARVPWLPKRCIYAEYPGHRHPMQHLADLLEELGLGGKRLGADNDGYGDHMGYRGPTLSAVMGTEVTVVRELIDDLRMVKTPAEQARLRASGLWADAAHHALQDEIRAGETEVGISQRAERQVSNRLFEAMTESGHLGGAATVHASFRAGPRTAMAHAMMGNRPLAAGDNLVSYCLGNVAGYHVELERTMFLGAPSPRQRELFDVMQRAQTLAFETIRPGVRCAEVEDRVRSFLVQCGYEALLRHHTGHGLGLEIHEAPFLDIGDDTVLQPGMCLSVEPGLYEPGLGGFRHSDTVLVTEDGVEILSEYPRDIEALTIEQ